MVTFKAHLRITIKRSTGYKQEVVLAAMLEGKSMPPGEVLPNMGYIGMCGPKG